MVISLILKCRLIAGAELEFEHEPQLNAKRCAIPIEAQVR